MSKRDIVTKELEDTERLNNLEKYKTALKKAQFVNEIKSGLGTDIKNNPSKVKIVKKTWLQKLGLLLKKLFTKF